MKSTTHRRIAAWAAAGAVTLAAALAAAALAAAGGPDFSPWTTAQKIDEIAGNSSDLNTPALDGCPIQSPDGLSLYMASNRPRFEGDTRTDLDIWVARRTSKHAPYGPPENLPPPVNTTADDFCPTPVRGQALFFVSRKTTDVSCGLGDIYYTRFDAQRGWREPVHLHCAPEGPNSALDEQGPSYVKIGAAGSALLFFSRSSATVPGDIFVSERAPGGGFGPATPVSEVNDPTANDIQPNVRKDGLEMVFSSSRAGTLGAQDVWVSTRDSVHEPWSSPANVGDTINTAASETRPALSRDARTLVFGRAPGPEGSSDIYLATREKVSG